MTNFKATFSNLTIAALVGSVSAGAVAQTAANDSAPIAQALTTSNSNMYNAINISSAASVTARGGNATARACDEPCAPNTNASNNNNSMTVSLPLNIVAAVVVSPEQVSVTIPTEEPADAACFGRNKGSNVTHMFADVGADADFKAYRKLTDALYKTYVPNVMDRDVYGKQPPKTYASVMQQATVECYERAKDVTANGPTKPQVWTPFIVMTFDK